MLYTVMSRASIDSGQRVVIHRSNPAFVNVVDSFPKNRNVSYKKSLTEIAIKHDRRQFTNGVICWQPERRHFFENN